MASKKEIFEQTLTSAYNPQKYVDFIREMITGVKIIAPDEAQNPYNTFSVFVANYFHVGEYEDKDGEKVGIFAVENLHGGVSFLIGSNSGYCPLPIAAAMCAASRVL